MPNVTVIGCVQVDLLLSPVVDLPSPGTAEFIDGLSIRAGGQGGNAGFAFAELEFPVRLIGTVGDDHFGNWMLEQLAQVGLDRDILVVPGGATGATVACEAPERDRTFLTYLGVNTTWEPSMIPSDALSADNVLFCDYFCAPALQGEGAGQLLAEAKQRGARTFFDTAWDPEGWPAETRGKVVELLDHVDVFLPNEAEACALAGVDGSPEEAARLLQSISGSWVVVKLGARGCFAVGPDGVELIVEAPRTQVVNTTGAGDAFNARLITALAEGREWPDALQAATRFASVIIARPSSERIIVGPSALGSDHVSAPASEI